MNDAVIEVAGLHVSFVAPGRVVHAVNDVSFTLREREMLGIVGESGSGKSVMMRSLLGLLPGRARMEARSLAYMGSDLRGRSEAGWRRLRGREIAMILQDPRYCLNPVRTIGAQLIESLRLAGGRSRRQARDEAASVLRSVRIDDAERVLGLYPHQVSGGMGQRIMLAMMLTGDPKVLIADEPTSALDVSLKRVVLDLLVDLIRDRGMSLILVSHEIDLVAAYCDRVLVMYQGRIVEECDPCRLDRARDPYTRRLLEARFSLPSLEWS